MYSDVYKAFVFVREILRMRWYNDETCDPDYLYLNCNGEPVPVYADLRKAYEALGYIYKDPTTDGVQKTDIAIIINYPDYSWSKDGRKYDINFQINVLLLLPSFSLTDDLSSTPVVSAKT